MPLLRRKAVPVARNKNINAMCPGICPATQNDAERHSGPRIACATNNKSADKLRKEYKMINDLPAAEEMSTCRGVFGGESLESLCRKRESLFFFSELKRYTSSSSGSSKLSNLGKDSDPFCRITSYHRCLQDPPSVQ